MGNPHLKRPEKFSLKDLNLQVRLETCKGGVGYDLTGRRTFAVEFFKKGMGFGITDIQIEVNPSLQPIVEITFKDLFGNTIYGTQEKKVYTNSDGSSESIDYSILFDWPPPKFLLTFKGYLGQPVTWILTLKKHTISYDSSDGSHMVKCSFVPNQWGFFADIPFLYLLAVKGLKKDNNPTASPEETIFDYIKIGKQVEIKTQEKTREFDGIVNQLGSIKQNVIGAVMDSKIITFGTPIDGEVNGQIIQGFTAITINQPPNITNQQIKGYQSNVSTLENINAYTLIHATVGNKKVTAPSSFTGFSARTDEVQNQIKLIRSVVDSNIKLIDDEIKRRVFDSSEKKLGQLTIGSVFSKLAGDSAYVLGRIIEAGSIGYNNNKASRDGATGKIMGKSFPIEFQDGKQVPADGYGNEEKDFVDQFIKSLTEGIVSNRDFEGAAGSAGLTTTSDTLGQRINNLEILNQNPYKATYESIASGILARSGIAGYLTRSNDPNLPGDYAGGVGRIGVDRDFYDNIQQLADNDYKNLSDDTFNSLTDEDFLTLKKFALFWDRLLAPNGKYFLNFNGEEIETSFKSNHSSTISQEIKDYRVVLANDPSSGLNFNDQNVLKTIGDKDKANVVMSVGDAITQVVSLMAPENGKFFYNGFENVLSLDRMVHYGIPYLVKPTFGTDYFVVMFQGEDVNAISSKNTAPTDVEYSTADKDGSLTDVLQKEPLGIIPLDAYRDDDGDVLGRINIINDYISEGRVVDYKKLRETDMYLTTGGTASGTGSTIATGGTYRYGFDDILWKKEIVERISNDQTQALPEKLAFTIYTQNEGAPVVWDLFYGGDNRGRNQRVYLKRMCKNMLERLTKIEEEKSQSIGNVLGRANEQKDMMYIQMHNLYHQWNILALEKKGKDARKICEQPDVDGSFARNLEAIYGTYGGRNNINDKGEVSFIYDYPLNTVRNDKDIKVEESIINIDPLYKPNAGTTVLNIIQNICSKNNFMFIPIAGNGNYTDLTDIYKPYPAIIQEPKIGNYFHVLFAPTPESRTQIPGPVGGTDKKYFLTAFEDRLNHLNTDAIAVEFGSIDNNIIKNISINSDETKTTAEGIVSMQRLVDNNNQNKSINMDCSVLPVMEGRSYKTTVDTLGNAQIYPMQYFYLENNPMFGGLYQILKVKHSITPNNMATSFEGVRMRFAPESGYGGVEPITIDSLRALGKPINAVHVDTVPSDPIQRDVSSTEEFHGVNGGFFNQFNNFETKADLPTDPNFAKTNKLNENHIAKLHPKIRNMVRAFINDCASNNIKIRITSSKREQPEMERLYAQGRTKDELISAGYPNLDPIPGPIVTKAKPQDTYHFYGLAIDIVVELPGGQVDYAIRNYPLVVSAGKKAGFSWGGDWKSFDDQPHFETKLDAKNIHDIKSRYLAGDVRPDGYVNV